MSNEDLKKQADAEIAELPAESAAGNADPAGGVDTDPKTYEQEHEGQHGGGSASRS